jgi:hypothetical protein
VYLLASKDVHVSSNDNRNLASDISMRANDDPELSWTTDYPADVNQFHVFSCTVFNYSTT